MYASPSKASSILYTTFCDIVPIVDTFSRPPTISEEVYEFLRRELLTASFQPGEVLREIDLSTRLNVSRTPVREAIKRLAQEGLLEVLPSRGARVRELTASEAANTYEVRSVVEGKAASLAAQYATPENVAELRRLLAEINAIDDADYPAHLAADNAFHLAIANMSQNDVLIEVIDMLNSRITRTKIITRRTNPSQATAQQHRAIVEAIARGDSAAAAVAMKDHIDSYRTMIVALLDKPQENEHGRDINT